LTQPTVDRAGEASLKVVFGEADKMFRLIGAALAPSADAEQFLAAFFLSESADPVALMRRWSARRKIPPGIEVAYCTGRRSRSRERGRRAHAASPDHHPRLRFT
jgi:hypothetical protein